MSCEVDHIPFTHNNSYSIGVEIEFQILDRNSLDLAPLAPLLLDNSPKILTPRITHEFIRSILELQTGICRSVRDAENDLMETCTMAEELAEENGCLLHAASLHPFAKYSEQVLTKNERYERLMEELQIVGRKFISQGLHVHIGLPDGNTAMRVCNVIQLYLPLLLALSTSSPFSSGKDTGLMSYRTKLFEVLPLAGIYEFYPDWQSFISDVEKFKALGVIGSISDLWWDTRPNPDFGTIEVRICDLPGKFTDILCIVAIIQSLVAYIVEKREVHKQESQQLLRANKWQAVRHGLEGMFVDPSGDFCSGRIPIREAIEILIDRIYPLAKRLNATSYIDLHKRIVNCGTSADYQRKIYSEKKDFKQVIYRAYQEFWQ